MSRSKEQFVDEIKTLIDKCQILFLEKSKKDIDILFEIEDGDDHLVFVIYKANLQIRKQYGTIKIDDIKYKRVADNINQFLEYVLEALGNVASDASNNNVKANFTSNFKDYIEALGDYLIKKYKDKLSVDEIIEILNFLFKNTIDVMNEKLYKNGKNVIKREGDSIKLTSKDTSEETIERKKKMDEDKKAKQLSVLKQKVKEYWNENEKILKNKILIEKYKNLGEDVINKITKIMNEYSSLPGVNYTEDVLDDSLVLESDIMKCGIKYIYSITHNRAELSNKEYDDEVKNYKKIIKEYKSIAAKGKVKDERRELRSKIEDKYKFLEKYAAAGMVLENSICGSNNEIIKKYFGDGYNFEQSDVYLESIFNEIKKVNDDKSASSQACFDAIDLNKETIIECKDFDIPYLTAYNINVDLKKMFLDKMIADLYTWLDKIEEESDDEIKSDYVKTLLKFLRLFDENEFNRLFYMNNPYVSYDLTINKFQDIEPIIRLYDRLREKVKRLDDSDKIKMTMNKIKKMENEFFKVNSIDVWREVNNNQRNQRYVPLISENKKITGIVRSGRSETTNAMNERMNELFEGKECDFITYMTFKTREKDKVGLALYDFTNDKCLKNEYILSTYPATRNKSGLLQMVKIPVDRIIPINEYKRR